MMKSNIDDIFSKYSIKITKEGLDFSNSSVKNLASQKVIQQAFGDMYKRGSMTPDVALNLRSGLDDLVSYNIDITPKGQAVVKQIRRYFDKILKENIEGLNDLDSKFASSKRTYDAVKKDFYNRD